MTRLRSVASMLLSVALVLGLSACATSPPEARAGGNSACATAIQGDRKPTTVIRIGVLPIIDAAGVALAKTKGYFACEGLRAEIQPIDNLPSAVASLQAGTLDFSLGNYVTGVFIQKNAPGKLKYVMDAYQGVPKLFSLVVRSDSPITRIEDIRGKKVAIAGLRTIAELLLRSATTAAGMRYGKDFKVIEIPFPSMINALNQKQIDVALLTEPFLTVAGKDHGMRAIYDTMEDGATKEFPIAGYVTSGRMVRDKPELVNAFRRAVLRGQYAAAADRRAVEEVLPTYTKIAGPVAPILNFGKFPTTLEKDRIQRVADVMYELGMIEEQVDVTGMLEPGPTSTATPGASTGGTSPSPAALTRATYGRAA